MRAPLTDLSLADHVCLALVAEGVEHGWAIGSLLAPDGELGRIWSLSRPLTYRSIDTLVDRRLVAKRAQVQGRGRNRTPLRPTAAGRRTSSAWLDRPIAHIRDVRTEFLIKLVLRQRAGRPIESLVRAQQDALAPALDALTSPLDGAIDAPGEQSQDEIVGRWRRESAQAVRRFLDGLVAPPAS